MFDPHVGTQFKAEIIRQQGGLAGHYVVVPPEVARVFLEANVKRTTGTLQGADFRLSLLSDGAGGRYLAVGQDLRRRARVVDGSQVVIFIQADPHPDLIVLCEELEAVLELDEEAGKIFRGFTPGMQRSLAYYANGAKHSDTRIRRALQLAEKMKLGELYTQKAAREKKQRNGEEE